MTGPLVTAVVACYNHEKYIEQTIMSILNQTYSNIQLVVIDDNSTDGSYEIIERLGKEHNFIRERRDVNQGKASINANYAVRKYAKGKYLAVCASDDYWAEEKIQMQVDFMENHPDCEHCYTNRVLVDSVGKRIHSLSNFQGLVTFDDFLFKNPLPASSAFSRLDKFLEFGGYDESLMIEDWDLTLKFAKNNDLGYVNEYLTFIRRHGENLSANYVSMQKCEHEILDRWKEEKGYSRAKKAAYIRHMEQLLRSGNPEFAKLIWRVGIHVFYWRILCSLPIFPVQYIKNLLNFSK